VTRRAVITGVGLVSCLGEGLEAHRKALSGAFVPRVDEATFAPFPVHPVAPLSLDRQIPKRGDQRQMEPWQRTGTYAAGAALEQAGVKGEKDLLGRTHMIVAAGGGERDYAVDGQILTGLKGAANPEVFLNERLMADLRPTLFLAQLSNLLAGNISIVHGVVGSSRTFMGEEAAGVDSVRIALARLEAGQGDLFLVGGAYSAERPDVLLHYEMGGFLWKQPFAPVWSRLSAGGGMVLGTVGAFLVIEEEAHARARGAVPLARLSRVLSDRTKRAPGDATAVLTRDIAALGPMLDPAHAAILSGASGAAAVTGEEHAVLAASGLPWRGTTTALGHSLEGAFPGNLALAVATLQEGVLFPALDPAEPDATPALQQVVVTSLGHWRGEGVALVEAA
jgi:3-oxoacyl-[acyl-carrier-protein] synthase II